MFLSTTDAGPNEIGARRIIHAEVKDLPNTLFIDTTCLEHAQHLVSLAALKAADHCLKGFRDWTYYASLATCANVCRDICRQMFAAWTEQFGLQSAREHVKTLFPKACSGRWSGCDKPEERFLRCGMDRLAPMASDILTAKQRTKDKGNAAATHPFIDEMAIEETKAYSEKLSRWRKRAVGCFQDPLWWKTVEIMNSCRQPLSHLSNFLKKNDKADEFGCVARLACGKAGVINDEFGTVWGKLEASGCLGDGTDDQSQFARNFASFGMHGMA